MSDIASNLNPIGSQHPMRPPRPLALKRRGISSDMLMGGLVRIGAVSILIMLLALIAVLTYTAIPSIKAYGAKFLVTSEWRPNELETPVRDKDGNTVFEDGEMLTKTEPPVFGALPVIYGTVVSSVISLIFAVPLSFGAALFLVRLCPKQLTGSISFLIEFLAAIPSIAYGMWGLFVFAPFLQSHVEPLLKSALGWIPFMNDWLFVQTTDRFGTMVTSDISLTGRDMFSGGLVLAIMILPIITAISRDVLKHVPRAQIEGTLALGATWWQSSWDMLRYSRSALFGAVMLGLARASGETMAITMVIGNNNQINKSLFAPAQTMSSLLANEFAEASTDIHRAALTEVALILLLMSLIFNIVARWLVVGSKSNTSAAH